MLSSALTSGNSWPLWKMKLRVRSKHSTPCLESQSNLTGVKQCQSAVTKHSFHAVKIYRSPIGRSFQENKNLHFTSEHLAAGCVLSQVCPRQCCRCDLIGTHPHRVLASHLKEPQTCWSFTLDSVGWDNHKTVSTFVGAAVFWTVPVCCVPLLPWLWQLLRSPVSWLVLVGHSPGSATLCTPSSVPGSVPVSCMQIPSTAVNASLVFIAW